MIRIACTSSRTTPKSRLHTRSTRCAVARRTSSPRPVDLKASRTVDQTRASYPTIPVYDTGMVDRYLLVQDDIFEGIILDFRQVWTPPRGKFSDLFVRLLPEIFDRVAFQRELKGKFAHLHKMESNTHPRNPLSRNAARDPFPYDNAQSDIITILKSH